MTMLMFCSCTLNGFGPKTPLIPDASTGFNDTVINDNPQNPHGNNTSVVTNPNGNNVLLYHELTGVFKETVEDPNAPRIYLTFDDGPSKVSTPKILEILDDYGIKATFFVVGRTAEYYPDILRQTLAEGHLLANHGYSHVYSTIYASSSAFIQDIQSCNSVIANITGTTPKRILRFPAGSFAVELERNPAVRDSIRQYLRDNGWRYFDWTVSMGDSISSAPPPGALAYDLIAAIDRSVANGRKDIVVLAHDVDAKPWTPLDLPIVIEHCLNQGYVFRTLDTYP
ncbi:MAG: polysaccharide deacetylase [Coriobacteriia bacterium]|nr:polysaccharide deacetylase [Coriobacteriia bacterium]